jgi:hypothetical protein
MGLDSNKWFKNVELVAAKRIGRETVQYVSNIYKYFIVYRLILEKEKLKSPRWYILNILPQGGFKPSRNHTGHQRSFTKEMDEPFCWKWQERWAMGKKNNLSLHVLWKKSEITFCVHLIGTHTPILGLLVEWRPGGEGVMRQKTDILATCVGWIPWQSCGGLRGAMPIRWLRYQRRVTHRHHGVFPIVCLGSAPPSTRFTSWLSFWHLDLKAQGTCFFLICLLFWTYGN